MPRTGTVFDASDVARHAEFARRVACRLLTDDFHAAEDIAQGALVAALQHDQPIDDMRAWLSGVVRNLVKMHWRAGKRRRYWETAVARPEGTADPTVEIDARDFAARLFAHIEELEERCRQVLWLRYGECTSLSGVAAGLGLSKRTVHRFINRGIQQLRGRVNRERGIATARTSRTPRELCENQHRAWPRSRRLGVSLPPRRPPC